jgi:Arc/MetJ-type ribon-helix-helix transcriptional regulator
MQIELSPRAEQIVSDLVARGRFASAQETLEAGLLALLQLDAESEAFFADRDDAWWADLRAKIQEADEDIAAGRYHLLNQAFFDNLRARARETAAARKASA